MQLILLDIEALASRAPPMVFDLVAGSLGRGRVTTGEVAPMSPWDDLQGAVIAGDAKAQGVADAVMGQSNTDAGRMEVLKQLMEQQSVGDWRFLRLETSSSSSEEPVESEPLAKKPKIEVRRMNRVEMQEELKAQGEPVEPGATVNQLRSQLVTARKSVETPMGAAESLYVDQWLFEPINVHALEGAGSLRAFGQLGLRGRIADLLSRDTENSGMILTVYRDSGACHGCKARLVSGVHLEDYEELGKNKSKNKRQKVDPETETNEEELCGRFRELPQVVSTLTEMRVDSYDATRSAFSFGRLFKELCRTGLPVCDIDQTFSVGYSLLHRHADAQQVRYLLQNREACYAEVGVPDRDEVKKFFNGILMGGGSEHCERFMLRYKLEHLPPFVFILRQEMCKLAARDAQAYPELAQELSKDSGNWRSRLLELLHELREREVTDMMAEHAGAKVCGWEYDGVLFACPPEEHAKLTESLQHKIGLPLKHKAYRSLEEILAEYQRLHPTLDWQSRDDDWFQVEQDRRLLRAYLVKGTEGCCCDPPTPCRSRRQAGSRVLQKLQLLQAAHGDRLLLHRQATLAAGEPGACGGAPVRICQPRGQELLAAHLARATAGLGVPQGINALRCQNGGKPCPVRQKFPAASGRRRVQGPAHDTGRVLDRRADHGRAAGQAGARHHKMLGGDLPTRALCDVGPGPGLGGMLATGEGLRERGRAGVRRCGHAA
ncbi:unnamed protein product [Effrenium voratum]|uniref:Uncharacterized protein n=1 Tax=Effrenium voratum TaxID=2562239 RepID=A0AA36HT05_9DINO|nr:unnamed protein product [Effrenium voratum]